MSTRWSFYGADAQATMVMEKRSLEMQMGPKEIAVEYRTAANKNKQIKVLAELNQ